MDTVVNQFYEILNFSFVDFFKVYSKHSTKKSLGLWICQSIPWNTKHFSLAFILGIGLFWDFKQILKRRCPVGLWIFKICQLVLWNKKHFFSSIYLRWLFWGSKANIVTLNIQMPSIISMKCQAFSVAFTLVFFRFYFSEIY